jgi:hypothetical protein
MKNIQTEIEIQASPAKVWSVLMDFDQHASWNPFIHIEGQPIVGSKLKNTMYLNGQKPQIFHPVILEITEEKIFRWEGNLLFKGLFDGEHYFKLEPASKGGTKLIHGENFRGILSGLLLRMIGDPTKASFIRMNEALKGRCEGRES